MNANKSSLPPKSAFAKPAAAAGKKVTKESAISRAFSSEVQDGTLNLSGRNIGDQ